MKSRIILVSLLFLYSCHSTIDLSGDTGHGSTTGSTSGGGTTGGAGLPFSDSFGTDGDITSVTSTDWLAFGVYPHATAASGSIVAPTSGTATAVKWANSLNEDLTYNYQELQVQATTNTPNPATSGYVAFIAQRYDASDLSGYGCLLTINGSNEYEINLLRFDDYLNHPSQVYILGVTTTGIDSTIQMQTPYRFGCGLVDVSGTPHLRAYFSSNIAVSPTQVVDYVLGASGNDTTPYASGDSGFAIYQDADSKINSYSIYGVKP